MFFANKLILKKAFKIIKNKKIFAPQDEIKNANKHIFLKFFHKYLINQFFKNFSSLKIRSKIIQHIPRGSESFLDASCGDDDFIVKICKKYNFKYLIANDIAFQNIYFLSKRIKECNNILFTNHNILDLPYSKKIDVVLCKNTLHHMHNYKQQILLLKSLKRISRRIILIDIEDPKRSNFLSKLFNKYYNYLLGENQDLFLNYDEFRELIKKVFYDKKIKFEIINTIKGKYMMAVIDN
jgi:SAM-dependent methyltransferase